MDPNSPTASVRELLARASPARPSTGVLVASLARSGFMHSLDAANGAEPRRVFVDHEALHAHAIGDERLALQGYACVAKPWGLGLADLLADGCERVVLDAGRGIELGLDRGDLVAVVAAFAFERLRELVVLLRGDNVHFHRDARGEPCGLAFSSLDLVEPCLHGMGDAALSELRSVKAPAARVLDGFLRTDMQRLLLDWGNPGQVVLVRDVLECLVVLLSAPEEPADRTSRARAESERSPEPRHGQPQRAARPAEDEEMEPLSRTNAPRRRPGRAGREARERMREIRALAAASSDTPWVAAELLANDVDLWVPIGPRSLDGMHWPALVRARDGADGASGNHLRAEFFSSEESARRAGASVAPLSGIEALRWIFAAPHEVAEVVIDPDDGGGWQLTDREILPMLFPAIALKSLDPVQDVPVERLSRLSWLHGSKPEVVRFFTMAWSGMYGPPLDGSQPPIPFGAGMYLPVFSHPDRFYEFTRRGAHRAPTPQVVGSKPPFLRWLRLSTRCSGVVVDPASQHAFSIETTELFFLQLWAENRRAPDGSEVTRALGRLQGGDYSVDQLTAGRVAADWPLYLAARRVAAHGERNELLAVPGTGDLALFTSERRLDDFARLHRNAGVLREELECVHALPRWRSSLFHAAHERFLGVRIDVGSSAGGDGVHLDGKGLDGALERLEERLRPRVTELRTGR